MKRWTQRLLLAALMLMTLTGCWGREEMNQLGIIMGLGIDREGEDIKVSAQVVIPAGVSSNTGKISGAPVTLYTATGPTLFEAIQKLTLTSPRIIFLPHIRVLVFSENFAAQVGMGDVLEAMVRDPKVRPDYYVMIAKGSSAESILNTLTPLEKIPANKLYNSLDNSSKNWAPTTIVNADRLFEEIINSGISPAVTGVELKGDRKAAALESNLMSVKPKAWLEYTGLGVIKGEKLIGWLNEDESKGFNYIRNNVRATVGHVSCPSKGKIALRGVRTISKMKGEVKQEKPVIHVHVESVSTIASVECKEHIADAGVISQLEKEAEAKLISLMKMTVSNVIRKYKVDIFGFGQEINRTDPKLWKRLEPHWVNKLSDLDVEYSAKVIIKRVGSLDDSFQDQVKE
ncbi:Ger(x)C family spore germination protein [Paenibacillus pinihumi]|uniref:Ger(x)C family spore germination protein n=1 Tax=Paenibacillus pinihumi TaxID=669462 RepID=UPI000418D4E5|nr:Ger(x)C family spore germination protein [Paenibacillus pinihumi]